MTATPELEQLAMLAGIDDLTQQVRRWIDDSPDWDTARRSRILVTRILERVQTLRIRLEAPLVVATFGGTGTGKSTLVNALVGQEVTPSGRQRPTTKTPILLLHSFMDPASLTGFELHQFQVRSLDAPVLKDIILIDCPDPDTSEGADSGSNLALLRAIVPLCDVLIYTSTQQKYRSARVMDELADVAGGCRLVFVQTHADLDSDIRDDWRRSLSSSWQVPEMFFVDSQLALRQQQQGQRPDNDFGRLLDLLTTQLGTSRRIAVRRANLTDLLEETLSVCHDDYAAAIPAVDSLMAALDVQREQLQETLTAQLRDELLQNCSLWERRLLSTVTDRWGFSPFSAVLRFYNGLGAFVASFSAFRARNSAQVALIGAVQGARWLKSRAEEREAEGSLDRLASFSISDDQLQETRMVIAGYVHSAGIDTSENLSHARDLESLRKQAACVEGEFLVDARRAIDELTGHLASRHSGLFIRLFYEIMLLIYVIFVIGRIGYNFFWSSFLGPLLQQQTEPRPLLSIDFYVPATIFLILWSGILVLSFTWQLRRGLTQQIRKLAQSMAEHRLARGLFPGLEQTVRSIQLDQQKLKTLQERTAAFRRRLAGSTSFLGGRR
jgi:hypothetical protein